MNEEFEPMDTEENPYRRFSPTVIAWAMIGLLLLIGVGVYVAIQYYQDSKEDKELTVEEVEHTNLAESNYEDFLLNFRRAGIEEPLDAYVYNVEIPEEKRLEIDPMYNDPYVGYSENQNLHAALWKIADGYLHFVYEPDTMTVLSVANWKEGFETSLQINKVRGKKAELTKEIWKENNLTIREESRIKMEELNMELQDLVNEVNSNLGHF